MEENPKIPNYFVRVLIILFCIGLSIMIGFNFFCVDPVGEIRGGIFILISFILVLVLAESFDNFSIAKLVSFKREIKIKQEENRKLEQKNTELVAHLVNITSIQTQKQQSYNVFGDYYSDIPKNLQPTSNNKNAQELLDRVENSIVISDIENRIKIELQEKNLSFEGETVQVLLRHLAGAKLFVEFERIHSLIFGSQIHLLKLLNAAVPDGYPELEVYEYFEAIKRQFNDVFVNWTAETYLKFLYSHVLIIKNDSNYIQITNLGVEYLVWITKSGLSEDKNL